MTTPLLIKPRDWSSQPAYIHPPYKSTTLRGPTKPLIPLKQTLSELTGPVYGHDSVIGHDADMTKNGAKNGEPLILSAKRRVIRDEGSPIPSLARCTCTATIAVSPLMAIPIPESKGSCAQHARESSRAHRVTMTRRIIGRVSC